MGLGSWICSEHPGVVTYSHIERARHALVKFVSRDPDAPPLETLEENVNPIAGKG
jgi:hypothetical protein